MPIKHAEPLAYTIAGSHTSIDLFDIDRSDRRYPVPAWDALAHNYNSGWSHGKPPVRGPDCKHLYKPGHCRYLSIGNADNTISNDALYNHILRVRPV